MKYKNFTHAIKLVGCLVLSASLFTSCNKDLDLTEDFTDGDIVQDGTAKMRFINAAPDVADISVKFNGDLVNGNPISYKTFTSYTDVPIGSDDNAFVMEMNAVLDSSNGLPGDKLVEFYTPNNNKDGFIQNMAQTNYLLKKDVKYVNFLLDTIVPSYDDNGDVVSPVLDPVHNVFQLALTEDYPAPPQDSCWARFYNLSSTVGTVDMVFTNNATSQITTISNVSFMDFPSYSLLLNGNYNLEIIQAGSTLVSRSNIDMSSGKAYTLYLRGIKTAVDDKQLELELFTNGE